MKFKLDENFGRSAQQLFRDQQHDAVTVPDEGLRGASHRTIADAARREGRILVTMDHDFSNMLRFPPEETPGVVIINPPERVSANLLMRLLGTLLKALAGRQIAGRLWIVEPGRIREHVSEFPDPGDS